MTQEAPGADASDHDVTTPHVQVVRGTPDDVELAALVAGLVAAATAPGDDPGDEAAGTVGTWSDPARAVRGRGATWRPGADAWRWSARA